MNVRGCMQLTDKIKNKKIWFFIPILITLFLFISLLFIMYFKYYDLMSSLDQEKNNTLKAVSEQISSDLAEKANKGESRAEFFASIPSIAQAFKNKDSKWLLDQLLPMFLEQKKLYNVIEFHFHTPPATQFLGFNDPKTPQEDVSDIRQIIVNVNKLKSSQKGIELGRTGVGIIGVVPVFCEDEHIGSLEVAFSFQAILEKSKKATEADISIFVDAKRFNDICTEYASTDQNEKNLTAKQIQFSNTFGKFRFLESTDKEGMLSLVKSDHLAKAAQFYTVFKTLNSKEYGMSLEPLFDFSGSKIGVIVIIKNFDAMTAKYYSQFYKEILIKLILLVLVFIFSVYAYNRFLMFPLTEVNIACKNLLSGKTDAFDHLVNQENEIGELASSLKELSKNKPFYIFSKFDLKD